MVLGVINVGVGLMVGALWLAVWLGWAALAGRWQAPPGSPGWRSARKWHTWGLGLLFIHAFIAWDNFHNWSHEMAQIAMELRTAEWLPVRTGAAIYLTYAYLALWVAEVAWSWVAFDSWQRRARWLDGVMQGFFHGYGALLILFLGGLAAHHTPPLIPAILVMAVVAVLTWLWRRKARLARGGQRAAADAGGQP